MTKFKREEWLFVPFETKEGLTEVWMYEETFGANIHFITNVIDHDVISKWMQRVFNIPDTSKYKYAGNQGECITVGFEDRPGLKANIIHIPGKWEETAENIFILCHEASHATFNILKSKGISHTDDTDEVFAYFQESVVKRLVEAMRKPIIRYPKKKPKPKKLNAS